MNKTITLTIEEYANTLVETYKEGFDTAIHVLKHTAETVDYSHQKNSIIKGLNEKFNNPNT